MSTSWGKLAPHISLAKPYATSVAYSPNLCTFHTHCTRLGNTLYHLSNNAGNGATLDSFQGSRPASHHFPFSAFHTTKGWVRAWECGKGCVNHGGWKGTHQKFWLSRYLVRSTFTFGSCTCERHTEKKRRHFGWIWKMQTTVILVVQNDTAMGQLHN